jgi:hypothetical protein
MIRQGLLPFFLLSILLAITTISSCNDEPEKPIMTVELKPGEDGIDAFISSYPGNNYPNRNFGNHPEFQASAWTAGEPLIVRSLIRFNLVSIPASSSVKSATLFLYAVDNTVNGPGHSTLSGSNEWILQKVISAWDESTVTWNTQPTVNPANAIQLSSSITPMQDYQIDVTELIAGMVKDPSLNYGLSIQLVNEAFYRRILFASSDHPDPSKHPRLLITYQ